MSHTCHFPGCNQEISPSLLMCARHWRMVPRDLQSSVYLHYRPGQEVDKQPSSGYVNAANAAIAAAVKSGPSLYAFTVHRPWGFAIANLGKPIENRNYRCHLTTGAYVAIHNGQKWSTDGADRVREISGVSHPGMNPVEDTAGAIIAIAQFQENIESSDSPWFFGPIGWRLSNVLAIPPVPCRGQQRLWVVQGELLAQVRQAYREAKVAA